jgi:hypothetical protein
MRHLSADLFHKGKARNAVWQILSQKNTKKTVKKCFLFDYQHI